ncbi:MAG: DUF1801 domain-containing protein [Bacteroidota bacterium]
MPTHARPPSNVAATFDSYPPAVRAKLLDLRQLVLDTAAATEGVGQVEEALKWGEPSILTRSPRSGTTVRLAPVQSTEDRYGLFVNCQTTLIGAFRQMYPDRFTFDGTRAITFHVDEPIPTDELRHCIAMALCYHLDKR